MSGDCRTKTMPIPRASASIIRSIRQISLYREWVMMRGYHGLPNFTNFKPSERAGDASEISVSQIVHEGKHIRYRVFEAGQRIEAASGKNPAGMFLDEFLDPAIIAISQNAWDTTVIEQLPVYCIIEIRDAKDIPVTMEHLYLPFSTRHDTSDYLVASIHIFSEQARYEHSGLFQAAAYHKQKRHEYIIDPAMTFAEQVAHETDIVFI